MFRFDSFLRSTKVTARILRPSRMALTSSSRLPRRMDFKSSLEIRRSVCLMGFLSFFLMCPFFHRSVTGAEAPVDHASCRKPFTKIVMIL